MDSSVDSHSKSSGSFGQLPLQGPHSHVQDPLHSDKSLNNEQIEEDMEDVPGFLGVFPHDEISTIIPKEGDSLIINLENHTLPGSHWIPFYFSSTDAIYCDSYGVPPDDRSFKLLGKYGKDIQYSEKQIQEDCSTECGYYSMAIIRMLQSGMTLEEALAEFTPEPSQKNEELVLDITEDASGS